MKPSMGNARSRPNPNEIIGRLSQQAPWRSRSRGTEPAPDRTAFGTAPVSFTHVVRPDDEGAPTLCISGEVDLSRRDELRRELEALIAEAHEPALVDLSGVTFIDSSGLAELVDAQKRAAVSCTRIVLVAPSPQTVTVLELTGLVRFFEMRWRAEATTPATPR